MTGSRPYESFKWSPDSSKILFVTDKKNGVYDLALGTSTEFGFEGDVIGWASNTNLVYVVLTENSPSTNADNVYNLRTASYLEQQNSTDIDTKVGPGVFSFVGAF